MGHEVEEIDTTESIVLTFVIISCFASHWYAENTESVHPFISALTWPFLTLDPPSPTQSLPFLPTLMIHKDNSPSWTETNFSFCPPSVIVCMGQARDFRWFDVTETL